MSKYKRYDKYKDSGVEWLGKIPGHWEVAGFKKYLATIVDYRGKTPEKKEEGIFLVTARNIKKENLIILVHKSIFPKKIMTLL